MPLDPQLQVVFKQMVATKVSAPPIETMTPEQARQMTKMVPGRGGKVQPVARVENLSIPGPQGAIPVRIYTPDGSGPFPVLVFFHGGGWVLCNLDTHDGLCRSLANGANCLVISVDYRLAPEHKFPAAPQDCSAATQWVAQHVTQWNGEPSRIAIGGDSAGGNLAAVVAQMAS